VVARDAPMRDRVDRDDETGTFVCWFRTLCLDVHA
jgi:hypothetical protein